MKYSCLKNDVFSFADYSIMTIQFRDIMDIKNWRNDQISILRQNKILTDEDQIKYYNKLILSSIEAKEPTIILMSYLLNGACIGYGGLTNIDWISRRAEISFLLDSKRILDSDLYQKEFGIFLKLIKKLTFEELKFNRLFTETFDIRPVHIDVLERNGFVLEGRLRQHVFVEEKYVDSLIHGFLKENHHVER